MCSLALLYNTYYFGRRPISQFNEYCVLGIDRSVEGLKFIRNDDFVLVYMPNEEQEGDGSSGIPVHRRKVLQPLEFSGYVGGELLNILRRKHTVAHKLMKLKLCLLISVDPEPRGRSIDVGEVRLHEHIHERHEVRIVKGCCSLCNKPRNSTEVQDCELEVLRRQLPIVGGPRSHPIGGGIIGSKVRTSGRFLEVVLLSQEESKELFGIGRELLNGLVLIGDEFCNNKVLLSWSLQEDAHGNACNAVVGLEVLPPILLECIRRIDKA